MNHGYDTSRVVAILTRHFFKSGGAGQSTKPFAEFSPDVKIRIAEQCHFELDEQPILLCYHKGHMWTLITTHHVVVTQEAKQWKVRWTELAEIEPSNIESCDKEDPKRSMSELAVSLKNGDKIVISLEPGPPYLGFWNCLILARRMAPEEERRRAAASCSRDSMEL